MERRIDHSIIRQTVPTEEELERKARRLNDNADSGPKPIRLNGRTIERAPYNTDALVRQGWCCWRCGDRKSALRNFGCALRKDSSNASAREAFDRTGRYDVPVKIARNLRQDDRHGEAADLYEWIVSRRGLVYEKTGLAAVYMDLCKYHDALELVDEVLRENPRDEYASNVRDKILGAQGFGDERPA